MDEIGRDRIYTMPFAEMKQNVRRSLTILTRETFLYIEIRPQTTNDPDYVLYEVWNKKKDSRLGEVEVTKFSEQQTDVAFQIEPTIEGDDRAFLDWFVEFFFDKVDDLHKGMGLLQQARRPRNLVEADDPEPPIAPQCEAYERCRLGEAMELVLQQRRP